MHEKTNRRGILHSAILRRYKIKVRLLIAFSIVAIIPIVSLLFLFYNLFRQSVENSAIQSAVQQITLIKKNIEFILAECTNDVTQFTTALENIKDIKEFDEMTSTEKYRSIYELNERILNVTRNSKHIASIEVCTQHEMLVYSPYRITAENLEQSRFYSDAMSSIDRIVWFGTRQIEYGDYVSESFTHDNRLGIVMSAKIRNNVNGRYIGLVNILVREQTFFSAYNALDLQKNGASTYIIDSHGMIVSSDDKSRLGQSDKIEIINTINLDTRAGEDDRLKNWSFINIDSKRYLLSYIRIDDAGWYVIELTDYYTLMKPFYSMFQITLTVTVLSFVTILFLSILVTNSIAKPVGKIVRSMSRVDFKQLDQRVIDNGHDEITQLFESYNTMIQQLRQMLDEVNHANTMQRKAEFDALQMHINPHFLYNTLDSINWMAYMANQQGISDMVCSLSLFFRLSLNKGGDTYTIQHEIDHVKSYANIQKYRYRDKIKIQINVDERTLPCTTFKLLLQPLVENAIIHGLEPNYGTGNIDISIRMVGKDIEMTVSDDGVGLPAGFDHKHVELIESAGYGLRNINQKIKLFFGDQYGLTLEPNPTHGLTVRVRIAAKMEDEKTA